MLAQKYQLSFVHHPFARSYHSPDVDWESFLGFSDQETTAEEVLSNKDLKVIYLPPVPLTSRRNHLILSRLITRVYPQNNVVFHMGNAYLSSDINQSELMPSVYRQKYWKRRRTAPMPSAFFEDSLNVAVHVRRGDVASLKETQPDQWKHRWIEVSYYKELLSDLLTSLPTSRINIHIYSDGDEQELADLADLPNTTLHLHDDPTQSFHDMVVADVLVVSSSAFSICAGKISEQVKLVGRHFDTADFRLFIPNTGDWLRVEKDGRLSADTKKKLIAQTCLHSSLANQSVAYGYRA